MSKIQDALRKMQSDQRPRRGTRETPDIAPTIAAVERNGTTGDGSEPDVIVNVDYDGLRKAGLLAPTDQRRHIADEYRLIKRPLLDNASGKGAHSSVDSNIIMVASPLAGDGKTFNCINLALSIAAERDLSVLLVDSDVAKPHISHLFGISDELGLIDLLNDPGLDTEKVLLPTSVTNLSILSAGRRDEHATELLASQRMADVIDELSRDRPDRIVIFDSPPLLATSEARVLASLMGQIVLVVCAGKTPQSAVLEAADSLDRDKPISVLLNQSRSGLIGDGYSGYGYSKQAKEA